MTDAAARGILLKYFYERRRAPWTKNERFPLLLPGQTNEEFRRVCKQLKDSFLIEWKESSPYPSEKGGYITDIEYINISAGGVDAVESEGNTSSIPLALPITQTFNISGAHSFQIGNNNTQNISQSIEMLAKAIDDSDASPDVKEAAKGAFAKALEHPLVISLLGSGLQIAAGALAPKQ